MGYHQKGSDIIKKSGLSALNGKIEDRIVEDCDPVLCIPLLKAFLADDQIAEMTITSPCIGFTYTFTKHPNKE